MNAVDTNVLIYFVDFDEPVKRAKAVELLERLGEQKSETVLPWQVAAEFLSCLRRWEHEGKINRDDTLQHLTQLESMFPLVFPSQSVLRLSLDLSSRYSLSHWDSMLLGACIEASVDTLYSEDMDAGATYDSVTVINPFA
jgi:predicted nucleic acid-binding protein